MKLPLHLAWLSLILVAVVCMSGLSILDTNVTNAEHGPLKLSNLSSQLYPASYLHLCRGEGQGYNCAGPAYDNFTHQLRQYTLQQNSTVWGRRPFPLPNDTSVFIFGNSHTRQLYQTLICEYAHLLTGPAHEYEEKSTEYPVFGITERHHFSNNSTIVTVSNSPLVYGGDTWITTFEHIMGRSISSFDAIVVGRFNELIFPLQSKWAQSIYNYSMAHPELFDANFTNPTTDSIARVFSGPIVAVSMFARYDTVVPQEAADAIKSWAAKNRTNIRFLYGRTLVVVLGECSTDDHRGGAVCLSAADKQPAGMRQSYDMHRCTGYGGGHADLLAFDLMEQLYELLEP